MLEGGGGVKLQRNILLTCFAGVFNNPLNLESEVSV